MLKTINKGAGKNTVCGDCRHNAPNYFQTDKENIDSLLKFKKAVNPLKLHINLDEADLEENVENAVTPMSEWSEATFVHSDCDFKSTPSVMMRTLENKLHTQFDEEVEAIEEEDEDELVQLFNQMKGMRDVGDQQESFPSGRKNPISTVLLKESSFKCDATAKEPEDEEFFPNVHPTRTCTSFVTIKFGTEDPLLLSPVLLGSHRPAPFDSELGHAPQTEQTRFASRRTHSSTSISIATLLSPSCKKLQPSMSNVAQCPNQGGRVPNFGLACESNFSKV